MELLEQVKQKANQWLGAGYDEETRKQVKYLMENDEKELFESFYKGLDFGTAGLRGIMGVGPNRMNKYTIGIATQGLCNYLKRDFSNLDEIRVVIAFDCRNNGKYFAQITASVLIANGISAYIFDELRPTPELSFAVRHLNAQAGIVITASHNPKEYNGYKVYWNDGGQIIAPHDKNLMTEVASITTLEQVKFDGDVSKINYLGQEIDDIYLQKVIALSLSPECIERNKNMKIVFTPIHGTGVKLVPEALEKMGFKNIIHVPEQDITDGNFPTVKSPNPEEASALAMALQKAKETDAELVMATDPDADRVGIAIKNDKGEYILLNGNQTGSLLFYYIMRKWAEKGKIKGSEYIVKTIVTTELLVEIAQKFGIEYYDVLTGFKYIGGIINQNEGKKQFICGGEESYGYLVDEFVRDKDAVIAAALIAETAAWAKDNGKTLFEMLQDIYIEFGFYYEQMTYITKKGKEGADEIKKMMYDFRFNRPKTINGSEIVCVKDYETLKELDVKSGNEKTINLPVSDVLQFILADGTIISVRPSGTEPKIKFYIGVKEKLENRAQYYDVLTKLENKIKNIGKELGI